MLESLLYFNFSLQIQRHEFTSTEIDAAVSSWLQTVCFVRDKKNYCSLEYSVILKRLEIAFNNLWTKCVTDFSIVNVHIDELSSAQIWQHKLCATFYTNGNINCRLPIKVYYRICTLRHIRIEINHGSQNVLWVLTWVGGY
jgi:hypothetical protein